MRADFIVPAAWLDDADEPKRAIGGGFGNRQPRGSHRGVAVDGTTIYKLHRRLIRDTFGRTPTDQDAFLVFLLLHDYRIILSGPLLADRPGVTEVAAVT